MNKIIKNLKKRINNHNINKINSNNKNNYNKKKRVIHKVLEYLMKKKKNYLKIWVGVKIENKKIQKQKMMKLKI